MSFFEMYRVEKALVKKCVLHSCTTTLNQNSFTAWDTKLLVNSSQISTCSKLMIPVLIEGHHHPMLDMMNFAWTWPRVSGYLAEVLQ